MSILLDSPGTLSRMVDLEETAKRLRSLRAEHRLSRQELEESTGVKAGTLRNWEQGQFGIKGPSIVDLVRLAKFYRVSMDWLFGLVDDREVLPAGYQLVDRALVQRIRKATKLSDLQADIIKGIPYAVEIPELRSVYPPKDPRFEALADEINAKIEELRREGK